MKFKEVGSIHKMTTSRLCPPAPPPDSITSSPYPLANFCFVEMPSPLSKLRCLVVSFVCLFSCLLVNLCLYKMPLLTPRLFDVIILMYALSRCSHRGKGFCKAHAFPDEFINRSHITQSLEIERHQGRGHFQDKASLISTRSLLVISSLTSESN